MFIFFFHVVRNDKVSFSCNVHTIMRICLYACINEHRFGTESPQQ